MKIINGLFALAVLAYSSSVFACTELGKQDFKLDPKHADRCGAMAERIAASIGPVVYPTLKKGENPDNRPSAPFQIGGLEPGGGPKKHHSPYETLKGQSKSAGFSTVISSKAGAWECVYCVKFVVDKKDQCHFESISEAQCAGGVSYPSR